MLVENGKHQSKSCRILLELLITNGSMEGSANLGVYLLVRPSDRRVYAPITTSVLTAAAGAVCPGAGVVI